MRATLRRSPIAPASGRSLELIARQAGGTFGRSVQSASRYLQQRAFLILVNLTVAAVVVALPFLATSAPRTNAAQLGGQSVGNTTLGVFDDLRDAGPTAAARAQNVARGGTITAGRSPVTVQAPAVPSFDQLYVLSQTDTLWTIANFFGISAEAVAYANGITDPYNLEVGRRIRIPPAEGALYTVVDGDTVESVAARFKIDPDAVRSYNRLYFEPDRFAAGQLIFVQNAALPTLPAPVQAEPQQSTSVIARAAAPSPARTRTGTLAWPVSGVITQYFWSAHTGVDVAAPYGSGLASSVNGVVSATGWVAVGGLRVCIRSGNIEECYYHTSAVYVSPGQSVAAGQIVAAIGMTGVTTGPHVHWECRVNGQLTSCLSVQQ